MPTGVKCFHNCLSCKQLLLLVVLTVSPIVAMTAPFACLPISPVSRTTCRQQEVSAGKVKHNSDIQDNAN
jgi:hypothetical protein